MHSTAMRNGKLFFDTYVASLNEVSVVDVGSQDVNGSLRHVCPPGVSYIGVDFVAAKGVDLVLDDPYSLPFADESIDVVVSSSCFEHSEMFWLVFAEMLRVLRPSGLLYLNVPSNGTFHRYPVDCWRFYPDAGRALVTWARRSGFPTVLLESYISRQSGEVWNDFVAVFLKDEARIPAHPHRILSLHPAFENGWVYGEDAMRNHADTPEDWRRRHDLTKALQAQLPAVSIAPSIGWARDGQPADRGGAASVTPELDSSNAARQDPQLSDRILKHRDSRGSAPTRGRFWQIPACVRAINARFGVASDEWGAGLRNTLAKRLGGRVLRSAISIECGPAYKEIALLKAGIVEHFHLFETSESKLSQGRAALARAGLAGRATFHPCTGLEFLDSSGTYDLVFWDNSLHNLPDTRSVLKMSTRALKPEGVVYVYEYVGPSRFQWSDLDMMWAMHVRQALPRRFFDVSAGAGTAVKLQVERPSVESLQARKSMRAIDSSSILPALRSLAPAEDIWLLGGAIYFLGLNDVLANFRSPEDDTLLQSLMLLDAALSANGMNHYAAALITGHD